MSTATNETFSPSGTSGQLTIGGVNVASAANITSLIRTDWQGTITLSTSSRTNLCKYSQQIDSTQWPTDAGITGITTNAATAPDGTTTASALTEDSASSSKIVYAPSVTFTAAAYVFSIDVKAGTRSWAMLTMDYTGHTAYFNLGTGVVGSVTSGATSGIISLGSGWYRCWMSMTKTAGAGSCQFSPTTGNGSGQIYTGGGGTAIYAWGGQIELGSTPTGYIPTTTTSASITDYSYTGAGVVTLGQTASGTYVWNGSGTLAASGSFDGASFENTAFDVVAAGGNATATPSGVSGAAAVGTATISAQVNRAATGVAAAASQGSPTAQAGVSVVPSGVAATASQGAATVGIGPNVVVSGVSAAASVGSATVSAAVNRAATGVSGAASVGSATISAAVNRTVSGVEGTSAVGTATASGGASGNATALPSGVEGTSALGSVSAQGASNVIPFGVEAASALGSATASGGGAVNATAFPNGVEASGQVGTATVDTGIGDHQPLRIFNLKKRLKKDRVPLILDIDSNVEYNEPIPAQLEIAAVQPAPVFAIHEHKTGLNARRLMADRWMTAPVVSVKVKPRPIPVLATIAEVERTKRNKRARLLLLLAS